MKILLTVLGCVLIPYWIWFVYMTIQNRSKKEYVEDINRNLTAATVNVIACIVMVAAIVIKRIVQ